MPRFLSLNVWSFARFVESFSLDLNRRGLVLVEGENLDSGDAFDSNGAGKSMIFEALTWALTGKMARYGDERIGGDEVCYGDHAADVSAVFETQRGKFSAHRMRRRSGSPSLHLSTWQQNTWVPFEEQGVNAALATDDLSTLLGFDYRTLRNAIFLQGTGLDVAGSTFAKQMKLLESVLRFDDFTRATKVAADRAKILEIEAREHLAQLESWSRQSEQSRNTIHELETLDESERESELIESIRAARAALAKVFESFDKAGVEKALREAHEARAQALAELAIAREHLLAIQGLEEFKDHTARCPVCESILEPDQRDALLDGAVSAVSVCEIAVRQADERLSRSQLHADAVNELDEHRVELERNQRQMARELQDIRARASRRLGIIQAQTAKLNDAEQHIGEITALIGSTRQNISLAQTWSKRGFEELKAEILGAAAPVLNEAADRYANILSDGALRVEFTTLRESRSENLLRLRRAGEICSYESLSNGERRRIDLTIALALRSCARWRIAEPINISVWDEVFDKLDESGMRRAVEVLQQDLSELETVFVITHSTAFRTMFSGARTLRVVRQHGVSRVIA